MTTTMVTVGGVIFRNGWEPDADGIARIFESIEGWFDGPPTKGDLTERAQAHGAFATRGWRGARQIILTGSSHCPARADAAAEQRRLASLLAEGQLADLTVSDIDQGDLSSRVRLGGQPAIRWDSGTVLEWQITLLAPDPLRYGARLSASTPFPVLAGGLEYDLYTDGTDDLGYLDYGEPSDLGRLSLTNSGTAPTSVQHEVTGPVPAEGFEIVEVETGARLVLEGGVPDGSHLVLDGATGAVVLDGVADRGGLLTYRDWRTVGPGETAQFAFVPRGATSAATLSSSLAPAFW